ncbi:uncharacterized protein [Engystomops pustulosus]|uniref:uncharacterized protein isoform X2 n=1 Tax=Engystomops pustulosus TaxID=76066 RepID=UPI003AFA3F94
MHRAVSDYQYEKDEFLCDGWEIPTPSEDEDDLFLCASGSSKWRCKYLNIDSLVISPTLYLKTSTAKYRTDDKVFSLTNIPDSSMFKSNVKEDKSNTKPSGPCTIKYSSASKDISAAEKSNRVKRLLCITENLSSRYKLDRSPNASEEKVNISTDQSERKQIVTNSPAAILCAIHNNKEINREDATGKHAVDLIDNYKDAILKLRGQNAWKSCSNYSENLAKSSFHGHIQTCILQLSNQKLPPSVKLLSCGDNSVLLKTADGKVKGLEGPSQRLHRGHHRNSFPASPVITMNKISRTDSEKFVWSQNTQECSKGEMCEVNTGHVRIYPTSPGKENAGHSQDVWGFPAFHPYPMKTQYSSASSSRGQTRSGKRNQSAPRLNSSEVQTLHTSNTSRDRVPVGGKVTVGLMLNTIRHGFKQNHMRVTLGQTNRFMEA